MALHMTVAQMLDAMTTEEYMRWTVYFEEAARERQREHNRAHGIVDFTDPQASAQLISMVHGTGGR